MQGFDIQGEGIIMVLRPEELEQKALGRKKEAFEELASKLEAEIDRHLVDARDCLEKSGRIVYIAEENLQSAIPGMVERIVSDYSSAGWNVKATAERGYKFGKVTVFDFSKSD